MTGTPIQRTGVVRTLTNSSVVVLERIAQIGVTLVATLVIARTFGPQTYGVWQAAQSIFAVTSALCLIVPGEVLLPRLKATSDWERLSVTLSSALVARIAFGVLILVGYGIALIVAPAALHGTLVVALILQCSIAVTEPVNGLSSWYQAQLNNVPVSLRRLVGLALRLGIFVLCIVMLGRPPLPLLAAAWPIEALVAGALVTAMFVASHGAFRFRWTAAELSSLVRAGLPVWWGLLLYALFLKADRLLLPHRMDPQGFGVYGAAAQLVETAVGMVILVTNTLMPRLIYHREGGRLDRTTATGLLGAIAIACAVTSLMAPFIIRLLFGAGFTGAAPILAIGIWLAVLAAIDTLLTGILIRERVFRVVLIKWTIAAALQYAIIAGLFPHLGLGGVLIAYLSGYGVALGLSGYSLNRLRSRAEARA
ncbi:MATE family efflux transporter [Ralstonia pseudosolanacearum]|uniref:Lipopolysaccharide biosynthesis protein n=1 Tax=Ralstonia solanacearum TaxID=305 RepID=A0AA92K4W7_RALSL|nr:lipopolysaccharide biosynthesis protein [Ralstonia pseudosolanacearum]QOK92638.1 lipopolysaccharide biosynthesis protein [Ralstonia pseudosolanacearum]QOK98364.1 lipopolysaccharide biosynthesis protein [Ralstonia pseudosolanacearum]UWD90296.1 lipopolysaccharide biosynthesis protein [Ralstonia pseudosolanacearum]